MVPGLEWTMNSGQKVQPTYRYGAGSGSGVDPPHGLRWNISGTGARYGVDPK